MDLGGWLSDRHAVTFLPGDPPRAGRLVIYARDGGDLAHGPGEAAAVDVVVPTRSGRALRRRRVVARLVALPDALELLREPARAAGAPAWAAALAAGLGLVARGRLYPSVSDAGFDAWRVGPLEPAERALLAALAAALPFEAHALALDGRGPVRVRSPEWLITAAWDALADVLVRTAAAPAVVGPVPGASGPAPFADRAPVAVEELRSWLEEAAGGFGTERGADVAFRIELLEAGAAVPGRGGEPDPPAARAVLQLTSRAEPSLVVDAADLFAAPGAVLARFGEDAERDLLAALRRVARAWPPFEALLRERAPTGLDLDVDQLAALLAEGARALEGTGVALLWPREVLADGLALRAVITPAPGVVTTAGLDLDALVEFRWQATLHGEVLSEEEVDQLAEAKRGLVRLRGRWVSVDPALLERLAARRVRRLRALEAVGHLLAGSVEVDGEAVPVVAEGAVAALADRIAGLVGAPEAEAAPPPGLAPGVVLRPYQLRGLAWLEAMTSAGLGGCLADDMGLGKTLQLIALHLRRAAAGEGPTLVVCPTSLLANWEREVRRFAPGVAVRRFHGPGRSLDGLGPAELVVTSYGVARADAAALSDAGFGLVVADEAQHVKNHETATARALRTLAAPARLALTGTPVENRLSELWAILDWTTPGLLGPHERFVRTVAAPIERARDPLAAQRLARAVRPFLLRRRKTDPEVAPDLPARTVTDVPVPLSAEQATLYEAEVREALAVIAGEDGLARQRLVLRLLTVLKQICNHPAHYLHQPGPLAGRSSKLAALEELVDVIVAEGESLLVFSQFVECLALLEARLAELGVATLFLHGSLGARRRAVLVDAFQRGEAPVLLCSLKAGGVGLNLTRATHVVHFDRWWNPAVEEQATDRAHRIGQDRPVQVHRLIAEGTLEDRIAELIERKRDLAEAVVGAGEGWIGRLSDDELAELVRLGSGR